MTVFWSDPTKIRLTLPAGDELEEENYFNTPNTARNSFGDLEINGPGVAEIKAHNKNGIEGAITQLNKGKFKNLTKIIVTYRPTGWSRKNRKEPPSPLTLDVYATKFKPDAKPPGLTRRLRDGTIGPLTGMDVGYYHTDQRETAPATWVLVEERVGIEPTIAVTLDNGSVLGAAAETPVRKAFARALEKHGRKPRNLDKPSYDNQNPDVVWDEIAEMYAELARTTNDEFLAELANELAMLR